MIELLVGTTAGLMLYLVIEAICVRRLSGTLIVQRWGKSVNMWFTVPMLMKLWSMDYRTQRAEIGQVLKEDYIAGIRHLIETGRGKTYKVWVKRGFYTAIVRSLKTEINVDICIIKRKQKDQRIEKYVLMRPDKWLMNSRDPKVKELIGKIEDVVCVEIRVL